jgi:hypothetical protein
MEDLANCAQNIAAYYASGIAALAVVVTVLWFCVVRRVITLCYGLLASFSLYVVAYLILPYLVWMFVLGTAGAGAVACEGFW